MFAFFHQRIWISIGFSVMLGSPLLHASEPSYAQWAQVLREYSCSQGVDYARLKTSGKMTKVTEDFKLNAQDFATLDTSAQIAYLINLYNAATVTLIVEHYPIASIRDIGDPWKQKIVPLFGQVTTLDALENEWLRGKYHEPRIHVALNCASISCPPLQMAPFRGKGLGPQLEKALAAFLTDGQRNRLGKDTVYASRIFEWYGDDFKAKYGGWKPLLVKHLEKSPSSGKTAKPIFHFLDYDWNLNDSKLCRQK